MDGHPQPPSGICGLCDSAASVESQADAAGGQPLSVVDCGECGPYCVTSEATARLKVRPQARAGVRFEIFRLRSNGKNPRPTVDLKMVEYFCTGFTPIRI